MLSCILAAAESHGWEQKGDLCLVFTLSPGAEYLQFSLMSAWVKELDPVVLISCTKKFQGKISSQSPKTTFREHLRPFPLSFVLDLVSQCIK